MDREEQRAVAGRSLILLDRDGVLNRVVVDPDHGTFDSPLHVSQVQVFPSAPEALGRLTRAGYRVALVTNQPAFAQGKTSRENLEAVQAEVVRRCTLSGGRISSSHICLHRAEDGCGCRKPRTGLLEAAFRAHPDCVPRWSWMVGDGLTDVQAGAAMGLRTAFVGAHKCDACGIFAAAGVTPTLWVRSLIEFVDRVLEQALLSKHS